MDPSELRCRLCDEPVKDWYRSPCPCCGRRYKIFCGDPNSVMVMYRESRDCPHGVAGRDPKPVHNSESTNA